MSTSITPPPPPPPPAAAPVDGAAPATSRGGLVALILGIVALVFALIPFASYVAGFIAIAAIVVGAIALRRAAAARGMALTGLVLGIVAVILAIVMSVVYTALFFLAAASHTVSSDSFPAGAAPTDLPSASSLASAPPTGSAGSVVYTVTGEGTATSITYLSADSGGAGQEQVAKAKLPWSKKVGLSGDSTFSAFSLVAQRGSSATGSITCSISLNGKVLSEKTSKGAYAVVSCSGSSQ